jgi:hypothetical protein
MEAFRAAGPSKFFWGHKQWHSRNDLQPGKSLSSSCHLSLEPSAAETSRIRVTRYGGVGGGALRIILKWILGMLWTASGDELSGYVLKGVGPSGPNKEIHACCRVSWYPASHYVVNATVHYRVHKSPIVSRFNPLHTSHPVCRQPVLLSCCGLPENIQVAALTRHLLLLSN